ncbi:MAG: amidase [Pseudomonadota bacterium]
MKLRDGSLTSVALTRQQLDRINSLNSKLNAYITVTTDLALRLAERADAELATGIDRGPLQGIPIALKDNIDLEGVQCTCGSVLFRDNVSNDDAEVTRCLLRSGAVILGKTAMHEFAYGMSGINPHFGPTRNPWNTDYDAGGSSGGSAAAVAAGLAVAAIGTDTGGSVRQPAHSCGVVGFKPSFGQVSNEGVFPLAKGMDHAGPIASSVPDARILFRAMKDNKPDCALLAQQNRAIAMSELRIGLLTPVFFEGHRQVTIAIDRALDRLRKSGVTFLTLELNDVERALRATRNMFAEANTVLWDLYEAFPEHFGDDVAEKLRAARKIKPEEYRDAQRYRDDVKLSVERLFGACDVIALPTSTISAVPINRRSKDHPYLAWRNCGLFNFTGHPALSLPAGRTSCGLPVGLMLVGQFDQDETLLDHAAVIEAALWRSFS